MADVRQRGKAAAVIFDTADRNAAEADTVVAATAADQTISLRKAFRPLISERDLQCAVDRLRPGIGEENAVERRRKEGLEAFGELERKRMTELERGRIVEHPCFPADGIDNPISA